MGFTSKQQWVMLIPVRKYHPRLCLVAVFEFCFVKLIGYYIIIHLADRPGILSPTERAKWDAWKAVEGIEMDQKNVHCILKLILI